MGTLSDTIPGVTLPTLKPALLSPATDNSDSITYVSGTVYDSQTKKPIPASIQLVNNNTGAPFLNDQPLAVNGTYDAWTDQDPATVAVKFTSKGYKDQALQFSTLWQNGDVYLDPGGSSQLPLLLGAGALLLVLNDKKKGRSRGPKVGSGPEITTGTLITVGVAFLLLKGIGLVNNLFSSLGLGGDPTGGAQTDPNSAWKPTYWQNITDFPAGAITEDTARQLGDTIHGAFSLFEDDYNAIYGAISTLKSKAQVSFLAWEFNKQYDEDLLTFLTNGGGIMPWDGLSSAHLQTLITLVNNLPAA